MTEATGTSNKSPVPKRVTVGACGVIAALFAGPFLLADNPVAQGLYGLLVAFVTTLISVYATRRYSEVTARGELTRYGLQAWRNLDSLEVKLAQQIEAPAIDGRVLEGWLLDINRAKWAWRDLLREVFELQGRLQAETEEIAARYRIELASARTEGDRSVIESRQAIELAKLTSKAPLPLRVPVEVSCPRCGKAVTAQLGQSPGDTAWPTCPQCQVRFPVHRQPDVKLGSSDRVELTVQCPACQSNTVLKVSSDRPMLFVTTCPACSTHIQFNGNAKTFRLEDLKKTNSEFDCPECGQKSPVWVSPGRLVRFLANCSVCRRVVQVSSDGATIQASRVASVQPNDTKAPAALLEP